MPEERVELSRGCPRGILSPLRLPFRHSGRLVVRGVQPLRIALLGEQALREIEALLELTEPRLQVLPLPRAEAALRLLQLAQPRRNVFHSLGEIASRGISATERATRPAPGQCSAHGDRQHDEGDADRPFRDDSEHTPPRGAELSASTPLAALLAEARAPPQLKRRVCVRSHSLRRPEPSTLKLERRPAAGARAIH